MGKVRVIASWQGFFLGTAAFIGKMPTNTLTLLGAVCILIASVSGYEINLNFGTTSFLVFILLSRRLPLYPARVRQRLLQWRTQGRVPGGPPPVIFRPN